MTTTDEGRGGRPGALRSPRETDEQELRGESPGEAARVHPGATWSVAGKPHPRFRHFLCEVLNSCATDEAKLALDVERAPEHPDERDERDEEMDLQSEHHADETCNDTHERPPHPARRMTVETRRGNGRGELLVRAQLVFDLPEDSLFVV